MNWKRCGRVQGYARARPGDRPVRGESGDEVAVGNVIVGDERGEGVGFVSIYWLFGGIATVVWNRKFCCWVMLVGDVLGSWGADCWIL